MTHRNDERQRRWRLILGGGAADGICGSANDFSLSSTDAAMDQALSSLYEAPGSSRSGGLGSSSPKVARWLGDIRRYFPSSVVQIMQKDALERLNLHPMLLEPEMLEAVEPDVHHLCSH